MIFKLFLFIYFIGIFYNTIDLIQYLNSGKIYEDLKHEFFVGSKAYGEDTMQKIIVLVCLLMIVFWPIFVLIPEEKS